MLKTPVLLLVFLLSGFSAYSQNKAERKRYHILTEAQTKIEKAKAACVHRNTYSATQRLRFYPLNKAVQVKLVSFIGLADRNVQIPIDSAERKALKKIVYWKYPFDKNQTDTSQFIEAKLLNKAQINKLTDILYNIGEHAPNKYPYPGHKCYEPRNAVIFINAKGKIFAHIEICFECEEIETRPEKMNIGPYCDGKIGLLKKYFAAEGIRFGTDEKFMRKFSAIKSR